MDIGEVIVRLMGDTSDLTSKLEGTKKDMLEVGTSSVAMGTLASDAIKKLAEKALDFATFAFNAAVATGKWAEAMGHLSAQTGVSEKFLINMQPALARVGLSAQDLAMGFRKLSQNVQESADPTSQAGLLFERLGINISALKKDPEQALLAIADAVKKLPPGFERTAEVSALLGPRLMKLIPLLEEGSEGFRKSAAEATAMGLALDGPAREALKTMDDALDDAETSWENFSHHVGAASANTVKWLAEIRKGVLDWATEMVDASVASGGFFNTVALGALRVKMIWEELKKVGPLGSSLQFMDATLVATQNWKEYVRSLETYGPPAETAAQKTARLAKELEAASAEANKLTKHAQELREAMKPVALQAIDETLKATQGQWTQYATTAKAAGDKTVATWTAMKDVGLATEAELLQVKSDAAQAATKAVEESLVQQIAALANWLTKKRAMLAKDTSIKGQVELAQFDLTAGQQMVKLLNELANAQTQSDTTRITSIGALRAAAKTLKDQVEQLWTQADLDKANKSTEQYKLMETQFRATAAAGLQASLAAGRITQTQFAQDMTKLNIQAVDEEISAQKKRLDAIGVFYAKKLQLAAGDDIKQRELIVKNVADVQAVNDAIAVLNGQRVQKSIEGSAAETAAHTKQFQDHLSAVADAASAEVRILEGSRADVDDIRMARYIEIQANLNRELSAVGLTEDKKTAIMRKAEAERMGIAKQFPTFYERQLNDMVASNVFSMSQITTSFTSATAQWIVSGTNFKQFWTSLQTTIVQASLNAGVQMLADFLLRESAKTAAAEFAANLRAAIFGTEILAHTTTEEAKTAITAIGEAARLALVVAGNKLIISSAMATLLQIGVIGNLIIGLVTLAISSALAALLATGIALQASPFTAPAGQEMIGASLIAGFVAAAMLSASMAAFNVALGGAIVAATAAQFTPFAEGGIVTAPTLALVGEKGPEAIVPLNAMGSGGAMTVIIELDGRQISKAALKHMPGLIRLQGVMAR